jgi:hypothetical protein
LIGIERGRRSLHCLLGVAAGRGPRLRRHVWRAVGVRARLGTAFACRGGLPLLRRRRWWTVTGRVGWRRVPRQHDEGSMRVRDRSNSRARSGPAPLRLVVVCLDCATASARLVERSSSSSMARWSQRRRRVMTVEAGRRRRSDPDPFSPFLACKSVWLSVMVL